ncbi:MAG: glycoside hydrolase family 25 protein [Eubacteriales bacterium]
MKLDEPKLGGNAPNPYETQGTGQENSPYDVQTVYDEQKPYETQAPFEVVHENDYDEAQLDYDESELHPPIPVRKRRKSRLQQNASKSAAWVALILSVLALVFSVATFSVLSTILQEKDELDNIAPPIENSIVMPEEEGHYISYQGERILVHDDVPVNQYDARGFYSDAQGFIRYEVDGQQGIVGIDVSYHQQEIDWAQVAEAGVEFAMIRVGRRGYGEEGNLGLDEYYVQNILGATQNGIHVGVYFFSQAISFWELDEEIAMFLNLIENYPITYPVVFDWEYIDNVSWARTDHIDGETLTEMAKHFCTQVEQEGYTPMVYFNMDMGYLSYDLSEISDYSFWVAELNSRPNFYYDFDIWQYSFTGSVPGIVGNVDLNLSFRDFASE